MSKLTPAERIELKADMELAKALGRVRYPWSGSVASSSLEEKDRLVVDEVVFRYPKLVELVRRLSEEE